MQERYEARPWLSAVINCLPLVLSAHGVVVTQPWIWFSIDLRSRVCATAEELNTIPSVAVWCGALTH